MRYLITFTCYGSHLHGEERGSVDRDHSAHGSRLVPASAARVEVERLQSEQSPYSLDATRRDAVLAAITEVCAFRGWNLLAGHVRTNHVHTVVEAETRPEPVMNAMKSYASRALNRLKLDPPGRKRWTRHGSTRWLRKDTDVQEAIRYVVLEQGEPMSVLSLDRPIPLPHGHGSESESVSLNYPERGTAVVSIPEKFALFTEHWRPKVVARLNGQEVKLIKVQGEFPWHSHAAEDEMFLVWRGVFRVEFRDHIATLRPGQMIVVPAGIEHRTAADEEAEILCFEPAGVVNTGDADESDFTAPLASI